jgi:hypothetical protein
MNEFAYHWGLIDANYILFRNKGLLGSKTKNGAIDEYELLSITVQSFYKLKRLYGFRHPILIWDKSPYHKTQALQAYKADRWIPSEERWKELEEEKQNTLDPIRVHEIELEQQKIEVEKENFTKVQNVKKLFQSPEFEQSGFFNLIKQGYEADDLAFLAATEISERYEMNREDNAILVTADKDWVNFLLPGVDFRSTFNGSTYPELTDKYEKVCEKVNKASMELYGTPCKPSRYQYGILEELMHASHNNGRIWDHNKEVKREKAMAMFLHKDTSLVDYEKLKSAYTAMNMLEGFVNDYSGNFSETRSYYGDTLSLIKDTLDNDKYDRSVFEEYCSKNFYMDLYDGYMFFVKGLKA